MKRLAVLEFRGVDIDQGILLKLSDQSRLAGLETLPSSQYEIMTRENMAQILSDMGKDISECIGACEVEVGRNLGVDLIVTGDILRVEGVYYLTLKLHETKGGTLKAGKDIEAASFGTLKNETFAKSKELFRTFISGASGEIWVPLQDSDAGQSGFVGGFGDEFEPEKRNVGIVYFDSIPSGVSVELDGVRICDTTPCDKEIVMGNHQVVMEKMRYQKETQTFDLRNGQKVKLELKPNFGILNVSSAVSGVNILLDGESIGKLPIRDYELDKGMHVLRIEDPCYVGQEYHFSSEVGNVEDVTDYPIKQRNSGVNVSVLDEGGNAKVAKVYVDGAYLGTSPLTAKVPFCSQEIVVEFEGEKSKQVLTLKEKQTSEIKIVLREDLQNGGYKTFDSGGNGSTSIIELQRIELADSECSAAITETVSKYLSQVTTCYDSSLNLNSNVKGRIIVDVEISGGRVMMAKVSSNKTGDSRLGTCIEKQIKGWKFPSDCSDFISIPFILNPS